MPYCIKFIGSLLCFKRLLIPSGFSLLIKNHHLILFPLIQFDFRAVNKGCKRINTIHPEKTCLVRGDLYTVFIFPNKIINPPTFASEFKAPHLPPPSLIFFSPPQKVDQDLTSYINIVTNQCTIVSITCLIYMTVGNSNFNFAAKHLYHQQKYK